MNGDGNNALNNRNDDGAIDLNTSFDGNEISCLTTQPKCDNIDDGGDDPQILATCVEDE